jgi:hypothetical protein
MIHSQIGLSNSRVGEEPLNTRAASRAIDLIHAPYRMYESFEVF